MRNSFIIFLLLFYQMGISQSIDYPNTTKTEVTDTLFSYTIIDEYRWLEDINSMETKEWVSQENAITRKFLNKTSLKINSYNSIDKYSYVKYENPIKDGDYYFTHAYYNNVGSPALFYQLNLNENPSILVDPNYISGNDNISLKGYSVSKDSKLLAYQFSRNGSDWGEIKVVSLSTAIHKKDHLENIKFSGIAWKDDGFYYSRFPYTELDKTVGQEIYYHKIGTEQSHDKLIFRRSNNPEAQFRCKITSDERFLIIKEINEKNAVINFFYFDFTDPNPALRPLITRLDLSDNLSVLDNMGDILIASTFKDVNNGMLITIDPKNPRTWKTLIPEFSSSLLLEVKLMEDKIIAIYQSNRKQQIMFFDYEGTTLHAIDLPFGFSVSGFNGEKTDKELLFSYEGYTQPKVVYRIDMNSFELKPLSTTVVNFDYTQYESKELEFESFDGTIVPLHIIYKNDIDLNQSNLLLLKAYGGFGIISIPHFSPGIVHFLNKGGIFAYANIRGGGDKGKEWALSGKGFNKMNSFNDFISASEFLIEENFTTPDKFGITGASNGGLVVAVAMTQRPELYKVVIPNVAPLDMVRFEEFTIGHYHADEYGDLYDSTGFLNLYSYSPLHNIAEDVNYPSTLIMTSENDDRVPPFHSYKFAAKLQSRDAQINPILLRIEEDAGHYGATSSFKKSLKEEAAMYDFLIYTLLNE